MTPTKQTVLHDPENGQTGNCFSAVLASLLHVNINDVPVFSGDHWRQSLNEWLTKFGLAYIEIKCSPTHFADLNIKGMHHEMAGNTTRRADTLHSVVAVDGVAVFDPHPDDSGLTDLAAYGVFVSREPWRWMPQHDQPEPTGSA